MCVKIFYQKLWLRFVLILLAGLCQVGSVGIKVKAVPAIYTLEIPNVACYEATIPMFFHVELPKLPDKFPLQTNDCTKKNQNLSSSDNENYCELEEQFIAASNHIVKDLQILKMHLHEQSTLRKRRQATPVIAATSLLAGFLLRPVISKFTGSLFGSDEDWSSHFNSIQDSLIQEHRLLIDFEQSTHAYTKEMETILSNISEILTEEKRDLIWSLRLLSTKLHADIIQEAIQSCTTRHIPGNLIHYEYFKKKLSTLQETLAKTYNYTLAIDSDDISKYYKLPIADCLITPSKAHITINIPLRRRDAEWKLHEIIHTKFAFNNQVCELYPQEAAYLAVSESPSGTGNRTVLIANHMLKHCSIFEHQICMIPQFAKDSAQSLRCTAGMHQSLDPMELAKVCSFRCYSNDEVIITQISDRKIVVTNAVNLTYQCGNKPKKVFKFEKLGALEVNLDCECEIVINDDVKMPKPFPCFVENGSPEQLFNFTIPILWTHNFSNLEHVFDHTNLSHHVNQQWPWLLPVLNFTKQDAANFTIPEKAVYSSFLTVEIWLGMLTLAFLLHIILTFYCFFKVLLLRYGGYDLSYSPNKNDNSNQHHHRRRNYEVGVENERSKEEKAEFRNSFANRLI